jgi:hypothetical protein
LRQPIADRQIPPGVFPDRAVFKPLLDAARAELAAAGLNH